MGRCARLPPTPKKLRTSFSVLQTRALFPSPPGQDQLQRLSILLRDSSQSLVRRYHPLFLELQLDDRFIGENEFWTAIIEHPQLINGPVLALGNKARVCKTENDVRTFFGVGGNLAQRPKAMSPRILALIKGGSAVPQPESDAATTPKASLRSTPTKTVAREKTKSRVTEKQLSPPKRKANAKIAPKGRAQVKKAGQSNKKAGQKKK